MSFISKSNKNWKPTISSYVGPVILQQCLKPLISSSNKRRKITQPDEETTTVTESHPTYINVSYNFHIH